MKSRFPLSAAMAMLAACPTLALACSSCGCTLNADRASQGFTMRTGLSVDLRYDYFNQDELRMGTGRFDAGQVSCQADQEIQQKKRSTATRP